MAESIAFFNFVHERSVPYRTCDFFDELVARFASNPQDLRVDKLFSWAIIYWSWQGGEGRGGEGRGGEGRGGEGRGGEGRGGEGRGGEGRGGEGWVGGWDGGGSEGGREGRRVGGRRGEGGREGREGRQAGGWGGGGREGGMEGGREGGREKRMKGRRKGGVEREKGGGMILYRVLQLPPCQPPGGPEFDLEGASAEALRNPLKHFPTLDKK